jgi:hypothetical protein
MKRSNLSYLVILSLLVLALACEKEYPSENESIEPADNELLKSLAGDSEMEVAPDILVADTILLDHASVSQCREHFLAYTYDRSNRLDYISYIRRNSVIAQTNDDYYPGHIFMRDKFIYRNDGRLMELVRYGIPEKTRNSRLELTKSFKYDSLGQLVQIVTRRPDLANLWDKLESLYYDNRGNMVRRIVKMANQRLSYYNYSYDRSDRLIKIAGYTATANYLRFVCEIHYDANNNIERKDFYFPSPAATSARDVTRKWSVFYRYDKYQNPFHDMKLPVSSLFEWMDVISPSNITAIALDNGSTDRSVFYTYRYNNLMYPVLRYRTSIVADNE